MRIAALFCELVIIDERLDAFTEIAVILLPTAMENLTGRNACLALSKCFACAALTCDSIINVDLTAGQYAHLSGKTSIIWDGDLIL